MRLSDVKIGSKLVAGFLVVAAMVATVGMIGLRGMNDIMTAADHILDVSVEIADASMESNIAMLENRDMLAEIMRVDDVSAVRAAEDDFAENYAVLTEEVGKIIELGNDQVSALGSEAKQTGETFRQEALNLFQAKRRRSSTQPRWKRRWKPSTRTLALSARIWRSTRRRWRP